MNVKFPITKEDGTEFREIDEIRTLLKQETGGFYLLGNHNTWHGGIHITDASAPWCVDKQPIRSIAEGEIVAYRQSEQYLQSQLLDKSLEYSNNFCLIKHTLVKEEVTFPFYSLYMHLAPMRELPKAKRYEFLDGISVRAEQPLASTEDDGKVTYSYANSVEKVKLPKKEVVELVDEQRRVVSVSGQEYVYVQVAVLTDGVKGDNDVDARKGCRVWLPLIKVGDEGQNGFTARNFKEKTFTLPTWLPTEKERVKFTSSMVMRKKPLSAVGNSGYPVAGNRTSSSISAGTEIEYNSSDVQTLDFNGTPRPAVKYLPPATEGGQAKPLWVCISDEYIEKLDTIPNPSLDPGKVVVLEEPIPVSVGSPIGYMGLYESPLQDQSINSKHMVHLEVFSPEKPPKSVFKEPELDKKSEPENATSATAADPQPAPEGNAATPTTPEAPKNTPPIYHWIDGSDSDGYLESFYAQDFFKELLSTIDSNKDHKLTTNEIKTALADNQKSETMEGLFAKHTSEWAAKSNSQQYGFLDDIKNKMMGLLNQGLARLNEGEYGLSVIEHEKERIDKLEWMSTAKKQGLALGPQVWHMHPLLIPSSQTDDEMDEKWLKVPLGQVTFDAEGDDEEISQYFTRKAHLPYSSRTNKVSGTSGITIGRGFDVGSRTAAEVEGIFNEIAENTQPIGSNLLKFLKDGAGKKGAAEDKKSTEAGKVQDLRVINYMKTFHSVVPENERCLTRKQQHYLFLYCYEEEKKEVVRVTTDNSSVYGKLESIDDLDSMLVQMVIDLKYRGDYTGLTRPYLQKAFVNNDVDAFKKAMYSEALWRKYINNLDDDPLGNVGVARDMKPLFGNVPPARYIARMKFLVNDGDLDGPKDHNDIDISVRRALVGADWKKRYSKWDDDRFTEQYKKQANHLAHALDEKPEVSDDFNV